MKLQGSDGPVGYVTKKMGALAASASCPFVYHCLALLSFFDDSILAIEDKVEKLFPPSTHVFNKVDELLHIAETLPGRFDDATSKLPLIIQKVPFLDWVLAHVLSWLNFFLSLLLRVGSDAVTERDIVVDKNCNEHSNGSSSGPDNDVAPPVVEVIMKSPADVEGEALKGTKDEGDHEEIEKKEDKYSLVIEEEERVEGKENESNNEEGIRNDDPILELFESGWHTNAGIGALSPSQSQSNLEE